jgi:hypothetical protein
MRYSVKHKCGFPTYQTTSPPQKYLVETFTFSGNCTGFDGCFDLTAGGSRGEVYAYSVDEVGFCYGPVFSDCTGTGSWTLTPRSEELCGEGAEGGSCSASRNADCTWSSSGSSCGSWGPDDRPIPYTTATTSATVKTHTAEDFYVMTCSGSGTSTLSEEYTTEMLIEKTLAALPEWPDPFVWGVDSALRELTSNELSYTVQEIKWRIAHQSSATCYLKAWVQRRFRPLGTFGDSDVITDLTPYEWIGTGTPCWSNETTPPAYTNYFYSSINEEGIPEENGTSTIEISKWSCVEGYEPDISDPYNPQPNGFPDPTWEALAP